MPTVARNTGMRAVFFDLDGTIADSLTPLRRVHAELLEAHGIVVSQGEFEELNGVPLSEMVRLIRKRHPIEATASSLLAEYTGRIDEAYRDLMPFADAGNVLERLCKEGWKTALVTSNTRGRTRDWLARHDLERRFDALICAEDVSSGKPDPECYLKAVELTNADPDCSWVVEDAEIGIRAARAAGLKQIFVGKAAQLPGGAVPAASLKEILTVLGIDDD
jgi:HAD superfamily hydrolase (TIGR01509 family)